VLERVDLVPSVRRSLLQLVEELSEARDSGVKFGLHQSAFPLPRGHGARPSRSVNGDDDKAGGPVRATNAAGDGPTPS